jgi:TatD DNase family protein
MFIDTHCHLDATEFEGAQADLLCNAHAAGVTRIVLPSVARANFDIVFALCQKYPSCSPAYGIHPMYVGDAVPDDLAVLRNCLAQRSPIAVGEIGLDFFIQHYDRARQEYFFIEQLKLAREFDLPVLLHIRRAQDVVLKHLRQFYGSSGPSTSLRTGIAHAFNGSRQQADEFIKLGFKLGFGGAMTYSRATKLRELAATLPLDSIVLETDAPDIPPEFLERGLPNEPQYLPRIAQTLAELRGLSLEEIAQATTANAEAVLGIVLPAKNKDLSI